MSSPEKAPVIAHQARVSASVPGGGEGIAARATPETIRAIQRDRRRSLMEIIPQRAVLGCEANHALARRPEG